jgi:hypothetical protein
MTVNKQKKEKKRRKKKNKMKSERKPEIYDTYPRADAELLGEGVGRSVCCDAADGSSSDTLRMLILRED